MRTDGGAGGGAGVTRRRRVRKPLPVWIPWAIAGFAALSGLAFNVYDRAVERVKTQAIITTKLADLEQMINQVDDGLDQLVQLHMDEAKAKAGKR